MKNKAAVALGKRGGKAKKANLTEEQRKASTANARAKLSPEKWQEALAKARAARWPAKIHTLKKRCPFPNCKITNEHEHITN